MKHGHPNSQEFKEKISFQLDKVYLQLINLYLSVDKKVEAQHLTEQLESRFESKLEEKSTFKLLNEQANILRKHDNPAAAVQLYKKSLLSIKTRFKNDYLSQRDTSRILINIASTELIRDNLVEAVRYYEHALHVIQNYEAQNPSQSQCTLMDAAKVHLSIAKINKQSGDFRNAQEHYF